MNLEEEDIVLFAIYLNQKDAIIAQLATGVF
jgi:hypothetical protein